LLATAKGLASGVADEFSAELDNAVLVAEWAGGGAEGPSEAPEGVRWMLSRPKVLGTCVYMCVWCVCVVCVFVFVFECVRPCACA